MVRADPCADAQELNKLDAALARLEQLSPETLQLLELELAKPDSIIAEGSKFWEFSGAKGGPVEFLVRCCSPVTQQGTEVPVAENDARLLDTLVFGIICAAHSPVMYGRAVSRVRNLFGLGSHESLAGTAGAKYGTANVFAVLNVAVSIATVQLGKTSSHITAKMGRAGVDAYADALDACHFMTAAFANFIMRQQPTPEKLVSLMRTGRLARFGISPTDIDLQQLQLELSKPSAPYPAVFPAPAKLPELQPPEGECTAEEGQSCYFISGVANPRTAGDALERHLSRRKTAVQAARIKKFSAVLAQLAAVGISVWMCWPSLMTLMAQRPVTAFLVFASLVFVEGVCGYWIFRCAAALHDLRGVTFFQQARDLTNYTVIQGRRDRSFLKSLRQLRPAAFDQSASAGIPRYFSLFADKQGVMILGKGSRPRIVASFHWSHVIDTAPDAVGHRIVLTVRQDERTVPLAFEVTRAKVAWSELSYVQEKPMEAMLAMYNGMKVLGRLERPAGSPADEAQAAQAYESRNPAPLFFAGTAAIRERRRVLLRGLLLTLLVCALIPALPGILIA